MPTKDEVAASYRESHAAMREALEGLDEAACKRVPPGADWAIANALAHVIEAQEFWLSQAERLLREPGARVGRLDEPSRRAREQAIQEDSRAPYGDLWSRLERVTITGQRRLQELSAEALERSGVRQTSGGVTTASVADLFQQIADHVGEHAAQIAALRDSG